MADATCSIDGCAKPRRGRQDYCNPHYRRMLRYGDPTAGSPVRTWSTDRERFDVKVDKASDCWTWTADTNPHGYGRLRWEGAAQLAHRVSWQLHVGPIPDGLCVLHRCDNPPCVNPAHLFLGTHADNSEDMRRKGRSHKPHGERSGKAKLSAGQVRDIQQRVAEGESQASVARRYAVHPAHVSRIVNGKRWREALSGSNQQVPRGDVQRRQRN